MENYIKIILFSILTSIILGFIILPILRDKKIGQNIRKVGPESHYKKAGTPTMGGVIFIVAALFIALIYLPFNKFTFIILLSTLGYGIVGFIDDFRKLFLKQSEGLNPKEKIILQFGLAIVITLLAFFENKEMVTVFEIPFIKYNLTLKYLGIPLIIFIIVGVTNATNLTDGLDGLLSTVSLPVFLMLFFISENESSKIFSLIMFGVLIGFLLFNTNPADVFMGDTGSMAIGGAIVAIAIIEQIPIYLILFGFIYMIETLSVIIQVISYKTRNKKRVFLMTPIHHHYELKGYKEPKIVIAFTIVQTILCLLTMVII